MKTITNIKKAIHTIIICIILIITCAYFYISNKDSIEAAKINSMPAPSGSENKNNNILSLNIISTHNSETDCWLIINNKVLDVTTFINSHPGGREAIINNCGKDATEMFVQVKKHAKQSVEAIINKFTIGSIQN